jgi:hypothetical protein
MLYSKGSQAHEPDRPPGRSGALAVSESTDPLIYRTREPVTWTCEISQTTKGTHSISTGLLYLSRLIDKVYGERCSSMRASKSSKRVALANGEILVILKHLAKT